MFLNCWSIILSIYSKKSWPNCLNKASHRSISSWTNRANLRKSNLKILSNHLLSKSVRSSQKVQGKKQKSKRRKKSKKWDLKARPEKSLLGSSYPWVLSCLATASNKLLRFQSNDWLLSTTSQWTSSSHSQSSSEFYLLLPSLVPSSWEPWSKSLEDCQGSMFSLLWI